MNKTLGEKVKFYREAKGWTQAELAEAIGRDQSYVSKLEKGQTQSSIPTLRKIAAALGCPVAALLDDEKPQGTGTEG